MIIVQLIGGLGNQLFQYPLSRRIALDYDVPFKLDITGFETYKLHAYSLQSLGIIADFATKVEIGRVKPMKQYSGRSKILRRWGQNLVYRGKWIRERKAYQFDPSILKISGDIYLEGYWQNEKYFEPITPLIRQEFIGKTKPDAVNAEMAKRIDQVMSVCVHVRRADYASNPATQKHHGLTSLDYYYQAAELLGAHVSAPHFFVFSDDSDWAEGNLHLRYPMTFVRHNKADRNYEDLRLMSLCKH